MRDAQSVESPKDLYWDIRPCPGLGTIEFRICDMPATPSLVWGLASLIQCLVKSAQQLLNQRPHLCRGDIRRHWVALENKWLATRYGLSAVHIRTPSGKRGVLKQDVEELIDQMKPFAEETGDASLLSGLRPGKPYESASSRQRRIYRDSGDWRTLVADMTNRWAEEL
jgi:carboxylate-amine ligase